ncbi:hypothetical protein [Streptomyces sp. NPDC050738]|uniref:hypothetical protein n=1 Tax=Streptomyces sp. NPDC050738 TaxID=3154744 RepID=UPI0034377F33
MSDNGKVLNISTEDLKSAAPKFEDQSTALAEALTVLRGSLADAGEPWGDDEQGAAFSAAYAPHLKQIEGSSEILTTGLTSIYLGMVDMADGHIDNEELVRSMFAKIKREHEGDAK